MAGVGQLTSDEAIQSVSELLRVAPAAGQNGPSSGGENQPNGGKKRRSDSGQQQ